MRPIGLTVAVLAALSAPARAHPGDGGGGFGIGTRFGESPRGTAARGEGKVEVATFRNDAAGLPALGQGPIAVAAANPAGVDDARTSATYEAALLSALAANGYDTAVSGATPQTVELRVVRDIAVPPEAPHKPVSGAMETTVSNRGSGFGLALNVDLSKPRKALLSTRLEARIRDRASQQVLWEGRADILTREGSDKWSDQAIADKLAGALFAKFPRPTG